jgi:hypothetical protein
MVLGLKKLIKKKNNRTCYWASFRLQSRVRTYRTKSFEIPHKQTRYIYLFKKTGTQGTNLKID